jgi:hypothetical protein
MPGTLPPPSTTAPEREHGPELSGHVPPARCSVDLQASCSILERPLDHTPEAVALAGLQVIDRVDPAFRRPESRRFSEAFGRYWAFLRLMLEEEDGGDLLALHQGLAQAVAAAARALRSTVGRVDA